MIVSRKQSPIVPPLPLELFNSAMQRVDCCKYLAWPTNLGLLFEHIQMFYIQTTFFLLSWHGSLLEKKKMYPGLRTTSVENFYMSM